MEKRPFIVNVINFIRGVEPREAIDLYEPVREQLALLEKYGMRGSFLLQYDALLDNEYIEMLKGSPHEIGLWLEIVEPLVREAGIPWRGRFPWDWHSHVGFSVGYTPGERERLLDCAMEKFKSIWAYYPASVGSWLIDAHSLAYLSDKYHIKASCNCKDQWGTDGYTLWGGYYGQAYYPCRNNALAPAQKAENQIPVPVFRMLGSDPIYQYDAGLNLEKGAEELQPVITLEPVYTGLEGGGGRKEWVDWFFNGPMQGCCLSFNYAQAGQENSFGWSKMKDGLSYQLERLNALSEAGLARIETLQESGEWYRSRYPLTPNSALTALSDWRGKGRASVWFSSRRYRVNYYLDSGDSQGGIFRLRDLTLYDDCYPERYLHDTCKDPKMVYDNLPLINGNTWSGNKIRAGCYLCDSGGYLPVLDMEAEEQGENLVLRLRTVRGDITITSGVSSISLESGIDDLYFLPMWNKSPEMDNAEAIPEGIKFCHEGFYYSLKLEKGFLRDAKIFSSRGALSLHFPC